MLTKEEWRRRRRMKRIVARTVTVMFILSVIIALGLLGTNLYITHFTSNNKGKDTITAVLSNGKPIMAQYLTPNPYSRPQKILRRINGVVIHYTANPGTTAENNRDYFEGLSEKKSTYASSHYIIGLEGEIIQCIPLTEVSYASNSRNDDTISIECCHPDETGKFTAATYKSLVSLVTALCTEFDLDKKDIIRHYDVTGKLCPLYYVEHEKKWKAFKEDVMLEIEKMKKSKAS
jgi:N-acetylmuramoyl-L-alanine amidase CwlA